jgi:mannitol/fructose-specific phosphotransferase system IIA component (Ntr-type)
MFVNDIQFSGMRFGIKGDNASQIVKNLSWVISQDTKISSVITHSTLDEMLKNSMIGIGDGVGVFDWVTDAVDEPYMLCTLLEAPVAFPSVDDSPIDVVLTLISPEKNGPLHLQYLSRLTRMFREPRLLQSLRSVTCVDGMVSVLSIDNRKLLAA